MRTTRMRDLGWVTVVLAALALGPGCDGDSGTGSDGGTGSDVDGATLESDGGRSGGDGGGSGSGGRIGDACETDADCTEPAGAECFTTIENPLTGGVVANFPNGMCSLPCDPMGDGSECGEGDVVCASTSMSGGMSSSTLTLCLPSCQGPADCRVDEGYGCQMIFGFGYCSP